MSVVLETGNARGEHQLEHERGGHFSGEVRGAAAGDLYRYRIDDRSPLPDPASRFQPDGPHGSSRVIDPSIYSWKDRDWPGLPLRGQVLYEFHVGTFTPEGTWHSAERELPRLAELGVTVLEMMPVADFPGRFGWGYDGACPFAPARIYGTPDDLRRFVDSAHAHGIAVILDVVYNHLGPDGNMLTSYAPEYLSQTRVNDWGQAINFDGDKSGPVREFFVANAGYWVDEFHFDGLRLDATQEICDDSPEHILVSIGRAVREAAPGRETIVITENERQYPRLIRPAERNGYGLDGMWNDDFHHSAMVAMTGRNEAYYSDHRGLPQEFISAAKYGFLFQGQRYSWQQMRRGYPAFDIEPWKFVTFLQNHDQVANSGRGLRCHQQTSPGRFRAMTALLLLGPGTPLLFQGQEFAASSPFLYFADHGPELAAAVSAGRADFLKQFRRLDHPGLSMELADPADPHTFEACKLNWDEFDRHAETVRLHRDLLKLRKTDPAFWSQRPHGVDGAVLGDRAFVLRFFEGGTGDRLLLINLGTDLHLTQTPEPLLAPPEDHSWSILWSSEDPIYGGEGTPPVETVDGWRIMGEAAVVLKPGPRPRADRAGTLERAKAKAKDELVRERTPLGD
jgi:maltooligosyltrehalose trehalohydrolase